MYICTSYFQQFHEIKMFTSYKSNFQEGYIAELTRFSDLNQRAKVGMLCRQNESNSRYIRLAHTSIFGLYFMLVCLMKSICYSFVYSSLIVMLVVLVLLKVQVYKVNFLFLNHSRILFLSA